jgi:hypothetical protein
MIFNLTWGVQQEDRAGALNRAGECATGLPACRRLICAALRRRIKFPCSMNDGVSRRGRSPAISRSVWTARHRMRRPVAMRTSAASSVSSASRRVPSQIERAARLLPAAVCHLAGSLANIGVAFHLECARHQPRARPAFSVLAAGVRLKSAELRERARQASVNMMR